MVAHPLRAGKSEQFGLISASISFSVCFQILQRSCATGRSDSSCKWRGGGPGRKRKGKDGVGEISYAN